MAGHIAMIDFKNPAHQVAQKIPVMAETRTRVPANPFKISRRTSLDWISRWLVGLSRIRKFKS